MQNMHTFILLNSVKLFGLHVSSLPDLQCTLVICIHLHRFMRLLRPKCQLFTFNMSHFGNNKNYYILYGLEQKSSANYMAVFLQPLQRWIYRSALNFAVCCNRSCCERVILAFSPDSLFPRLIFVLDTIFVSIILVVDRQSHDPKITSGRSGPYLW